MSIASLRDSLENLEGFQNLDTNQDWLSHDPTFEWTEEELYEFWLEEQYAQQKLEAMAGWWDMEGVRCATFGRDPNVNPYREMLNVRRNQNNRNRIHTPNTR